MAAASTLSPNSSLTQCRSYSARKRSERERVGSNFFSRRKRPLLLKMECLDHAELFQQLVFARFGKSPYEKFGDWNDEGLWNAILTVLQRQCVYLPPTMKSVKQVVLRYGKLYANDPKLSTVDSFALRNKISLVFGNFVDKGCLKVEEVEGLEAQLDRGPYSCGPSNNVVNQGHLVNCGQFYFQEQSSNYSSDWVPTYCYDDSGKKKIIERALATEKETLNMMLPRTDLVGDTKEVVTLKEEFGYVAPLSLKYGEDINHLGLNPEDLMLILSKYPATSTEYMSICVKSTLKCTTL